MAIAATISFVHASVVLTIFFGNLSQWKFLLYASIPASITVVAPYFFTRNVIKWLYKEESVTSYFETLSRSTSESTPIASEVELTPSVLEQLPEEVADPDSVKVLDEELLDHVDGEVFEPVDADTRGVVAIGFAGTLLAPSSLIVGIMLGGVVSMISGVLVALFASWIVLQQHRDMVDIIEYTPQTIET